jgi:nitrile hydratase subunit alpha
MKHDTDNPPARRTTRLERLVLDKGLVDAKHLDDIIDEHISARNPKVGAQVVARAWTEPQFREHLLADADEALATMGLGWAFGFQATRRFEVVENTPERHNVIVCTLCSCYPTALLGPPPSWYKSDAYRSRVVLEPRVVLAELGLELSESVSVRVWDSTAETRYMVLPRRPEGADNFSVERLEGLITRDCLVGAALPDSP